MTMRDQYDTETQAMDPLGTDVGSGAPPEYAGQPVDLREDDRYRDERMAPPRRYEPRYDPRYDDRRRMQYDDAGPGFAEDAARFARRHLRTPETKEFFKTSEFMLTVFGVLAMMVAATVHEGFDAEDMWPLVTAMLGLYVLSRGIAKAGVAHHERDR